MTKQVTNIVTTQKDTAKLTLTKTDIKSGILDYAILLKPRVMSLVLFTSVVGIVMAPGTINLFTAVAAIICIGMGAGASGAINMWYERDLDGKMERTRERPIPAGRMNPNSALLFGLTLIILSITAMVLFVNATAAILLALTIFYYIFIYTVWLKRRTPQNIVIGGGSGALPPMIGWASVSGSISLDSFLLFAIIFMWTPPHFWALALYSSGDYEKAGIPMMPAVLGIEETKKLMLVYSILLWPLAISPTFTGLITIPSGVIIGLLGLWFIRHAIKVKNSNEFDEPRAMFKYSILYLFLIFVIFLVDRGVQAYL